jgi:predicted ATPase/class 3 adenylate cyclase
VHRSIAGTLPSPPPVRRSADRPSGLNTICHVGVRPPSGTVTFLFTDIEGSTRRWEADPEAMRAVLVLHDEVLRSAIEAHGGFVFKHTGDGVCAAFGSARGAIDAAVEAQQTLGLPVRMGIATGEAERRGEDYFGPVLNRTARVMAAGHGGQILVAASTTAVVSGADLIDRGEHRLRDLSGVEHLYQVRAEGLQVEFAPLRTVDAVPGNLPVQTTSFVGRDIAVKELAEQVRGHRLVTLTGVGGVGKTRLAIQVAAELTGEFADGVWLVELAPVGDPAAVPDVVATALGVTPQAGLTVTDSIAQALPGRRLLIVLDNCEHVLGAAGDVVEVILARTETAAVLATSREGLRLSAEQLWPVPSLNVERGADSAAVELFVERAKAVKPGFAPGGAAEAEAVAEICRRVDGIALAIELAAARMVSMSPQDVRDRLGERFRLLSGSRRGLERHQTLRNTVQWSYDLLDDDERAVLGCCSVFADGFDLAAATHLCDGLDEYTVLDRLDSLVRKSLVIAEPVTGHARYGLLETIRQFAEEQLAATGSIDAVRDRHASYFADQAVAFCDLWDGPRQRVAIDWVDVEYANLRAGFRWAADQDDLDTAVTIAAHTTVLGCMVLRYESIGWAAELLDAATAADVRQLPRLYTAASICSQIGRPRAAVGYAHTAVVLATDPRYDPFEPGISSWWEATANLYAGQFDQALEVDAGLVGHPGLARVAGLVGRVLVLPVVGRVDEALALAEEAVAAARAHGNPFWIAGSLNAFGRAFAYADPTRALDALREALVVTRDHRLVQWEAIVSIDAAGVEAVHGDPGEALILFETAIDSLHRAGDVGNTALALAGLAVLFDRLERPEIAATLYGASRLRVDTGWVTHLHGVVNQLRTILGDSRFDDCVAIGAAMELTDAVAYARDQIQAARRQIPDVT